MSNATRSRRISLMVQVAARDFGWRCWYCFQPLVPADRPLEETCGPPEELDGVEIFSPPDGMSMAELDHVVPKAKGGATCLSNLVLSCCDCNARKGARSVEDVLWLNLCRAAREGLSQRPLARAA